MSHQEYEGWAVIELIGGRECAGRVAMNADPLIRIDLPIECADGAEGVITEFWARAAILSLRPCTEEIVRHLLRMCASQAPGAARPVDRLAARAVDQPLALPDFSTACRLMEAAQ